MPCCWYRKQELYQMRGQSPLSFSMWQVLPRAATPQNLGCVGWEKRFFSSELAVAWDGKCPPEEQEDCGKS